MDIRLLTIGLILLSSLPLILTKYQCPEGFTGQNCDIECGVVAPGNAPNVKIVGGVDAVPASWPSQAYIFFQWSGNFLLPDVNQNVPQTVGYICGGTLIDPTTIVTAAHCVSQKMNFTYMGKNYSLPYPLNDRFPTEFSKYKVFLGLYDISLVDKGADISPAIEVDLANIIVHEAYEHVRVENDIALFKLAAAIVPKSNIQIACLPVNRGIQYPAPNQLMWVVGWGLTSEGGVSPNKLQNIKLNIYDPSYCSMFSNNDWSKQICAGDIAGGRDACQGDSGGPLYVKDKVNGKDKFVLGGVVSYGAGCARPGNPGIFVRVTAYLDWIYKNNN